MKTRRGRENPVLELHEAHHAGPHQEDSCLASWGSGCRTEAAPALPRSPESHPAAQPGQRLTSGHLLSPGSHERHPRAGGWHTGPC